MKGGACLALVSAILLAGAAASAGWRQVPITELVADSDLLVIGTLSDVRDSEDNPGEPSAPERRDGYRSFAPRREGSIAVEEVVFGHAEPGQVLALRWSEGSCGPFYEDHVGLRAMWLLESHSDGSVRAGYPWRVIRLCAGDLKTVRKVLDKLQPSQWNERLERLASVVKRPPQYECDHHLWEGNW